MAFFFIIYGMVYGQKNIDYQFDFYKKFRTLIIPYMFFELMWCVYLAITNVNNPAWEWKEIVKKMIAFNGNLGLEPTGHYWFAIAAWMVSNGISVVQVNPYAVKQSKEIEDNSQLKDDRKDPKIIANIVKDGNYGMPYLPEDIYADMRSNTIPEPYRASGRPEAGQGSGYACHPGL